MTEPKPNDLGEIEGFDEALIADDDEWDELCSQAIQEGIREGEPAEAAVLRAGVSRRKFREWMQNDSFRDWIRALEIRHYAKIRRTIEAVAEKIALPKDQLAGLIKYLERIDPTFSMKQKLEVIRGLEEEEPIDDDFARVLAAAQEAMNAKIDERESKGKE